IRPRPKSTIRSFWRSRAQVPTGQSLQRRAITWPRTEDWRLAVRRRLLMAVVIVTALAAVAAGYGAFRHGGSTAGTPSSDWKEVAWSFPMDQWGKGKAFACERADCGGEVSLYLRAKLGSCNCATGVADDDDLERMSDLEMLGGTFSPLAAGRVTNV